MGPPPAARRLLRLAAHVRDPAPAGRAVAVALGASAQAPAEPRLTFGLTADAHLLGRGAPQNEATVAGFVEEMCRWRPDFAIDMGDFGCQALPAEVPEDAGKGVTTSALHRAQLAGLEHHAAVFARVPCPRLHVLGNHDAGWLRGGGESITAADLIGRSHPGEDITKDEVLRTNGMPHRYYARQVAGILLIVLDANNEPDSEAPTPGHDGVQGAYYIDAEQRRWLKTLLAQHRTLSKLVFCHQELHHTPVSGSPEGGDVPFPVVGKEGSYVDNGWQIREMFAEDGRVLACFFGHKHRSRWAVYGGTHYLTMAGTHWAGSFAKISLLASQLRIDGVGGQRSYRLPLTA